jgi:hypothetical protein
MVRSTPSTRSAPALSPSLESLELLAPLDLAADQCTLFLIQNQTTIRRFDVCTGTFRSDFATLPGLWDLAILPDGGVLATMESQLVRFDGAGSLVRTYTDPRFPLLTGLGLSDGGTRAWIAEEGCDHGQLYRLDLATGAAPSRVALNMDAPTSVVPFNAWTAALNASASAATGVPALSTTMLSILGALLALIAFRRLV